MGQEDNNSVTVIGGSGFIGTRLVKNLVATGKQVTIVDIVPPPRETPGIEFRRADVRSVDELNAAVPARWPIVNLAAEHRDDVSPLSRYREVNVDGAINVCRVASEKGVGAIIFTSSVAVYGFTSGPTDETADLQPFNDYGRTKAQAESVYREWAEADRRRSLVIVRPTVVFGEDNRGNVYNLLRQIHSKRFVMIGHGENIKSMAYVGNVAAFLQRSVSLAPGTHLFNYVDKPDLTTNEIVTLAMSTLGRNRRAPFRLPYWLGLIGGYLMDTVAAITRHPLPISAIRVKKFVGSTHFSADRLSSTGFAAPVEIRDALIRTTLYEFRKDVPRNDTT